MVDIEQTLIVDAEPLRPFKVLVLINVEAAKRLLRSDAKRIMAAWHGRHQVLLSDL